MGMGKGGGKGGEAVAIDLTKFARKLTPMPITTVDSIAISQEILKFIT